MSTQTESSSQRILRKVTMAGFSLVLFLSSCGEDKLIYQGTVSGSTKTFDLKVDGSAFPVQTIKLDVEGAGQEGCQISIQNMGPVSVATTVHQEGGNSTDGGMIDLKTGGDLLVYEGSLEAANFVLGDLGKEAINLRVKLTLRDSNPKDRKISVRRLWADGP